MLELFSRNPDGLVLGYDSHLTPIPVAEDVSSLSAILLDDEYYSFMHGRKRQVGGVSVVVGEECLIPLKARAWLDLVARREAGERVDSRDIKKHRNDILRLFQLLRPDQPVALPATVREDLSRFFVELDRETGLDPKTLGVTGISLPEIVQALRDIYGIAPSHV